MRILPLLLVALLTSSFSLNATMVALKDWKDSVYDQIKTEARKGLKDLFKREVYIGRVGGIIAGQIILKEVVVPEIGRAKKIYINFNPVKFMYKKDIIPAISKVTIEDGEFRVERNKKDQWNVLTLLPPEEPGAPPPPPFRAKLVFKNSKVDYVDQLGFRTLPQKFTEKIVEINGEISFRRKDKISLNLSGKIYKPLSPTQAKVFGFYNLKTGNYAINANAQRIDLEKWGNYIIPFEPAEFKGGEADLVLKISPPKIKEWPVSLTGNFSFYNASGQYAGYKIERTFGNLAIADDRLAFQDLSLQINTIPVKINGRFFDFVKQNLDLKVALEETNLKKLVSLFPQTKDLDLRGLGGAEFILQGTVTAPKVKGIVAVKKGKFYNQNFAGKSSLTFAQNLLKIDVTDLRVYKGKLTGAIEIDFSPKLPEISLSATLSSLDLTQLSQNVTGIVGKASGKLNLSGPTTNVKGNLSANLTNALFFGQALDNISSTFLIKDGDIYIESFEASSKTASIHTFGKIGHDLIFDFHGQAQGIRLSGEGILGKMETMVNFFRGDISGKWDEKFLAEPLKNLTASGEVNLSQGKVGEQQFDFAQGRLSLREGLICIQDLTFRKDKSILYASGQTGIGFPTQLNFAGEKINLEDLKILNYLLPEEAKNPSGYTDIKVEITGEISREVQITSFDPLLDLNAKGEISLINVRIADVPITSGTLNFGWQNRDLNLQQCTFKTPNSDLSFDLFYGKEGKAKGKFLGIVDFSEFKKFTSKYGKLAGKLGLNLILQGEVRHPVVAASFWLRDFRFNNIDFDKIEGSVHFSENKLTLSKPILFAHGLNRYEISGVANLEGLRKNQPEESYLDLHLKIIEADLSGVVSLFEKIRSEFSRRFYIAPPGEKSRINLASLVMPTIRQFVRQGDIIFYAQDGEKDYFLKTWGNIVQELEKAVAVALEENLGGELLGTLSLKGKFKNLSGTFIGQVKNGFFRNFTFENLRAKASLKDKKIKIEKLLLEKDKGTLSASGDLSLEGDLFLHVIANNMPLDILKIGFDKDFKGTFNMNASVDGPIQNLRVVAAVGCKNITLAGIYFDKATLSLTKKDSSIYIHELSLRKGNRLSSVYGSFRTSPPNKVDLEITLRDDALGLINLFTDEVRWLKGASFATLKIMGTLENPKMEGKISIDHANLYVKAIDSAIENISGEAQIKNNILQIPSLTGTWKGERTKYWPNFLGVAGSVRLDKILSEDKMIDLNLVFSPTHLYIDLPHLYTGAISIKEMRLNGPLHFDFSKGPTLSGKAEVNNAVITLARKQARVGKIFPLNFELTVDLNKNVYAVMGDIWTTDLSSIFMNLEIKGEEIKVSGNLEYPSLLGKIFLKRGTVTILNREFSLLSTEAQKRYYPYESEKIKENVVIFTGEKGVEGVMPRVTITAKVEVEHLEEEAGELEKKKVIILSHLHGTIGAVEKERGLNIAFASFSEDKTKVPYEIKPAGYSEQDIKVMLLPNFIKSLAGITVAEEAADTSAVIADYVSSRFQTWVFRSIERELEQRFGLESLTLEYNIGKDIRQAMGVKEARDFEEEKPDWRVGFVKGFFDKFYVDIRYSQGIEEKAGGVKTSFNYQLTYKLSPILSIIYYREPTSLEELTTGYQKITLKAGLSFW